MRGTMLGHERIIFSVHRTRLDMQKTTVVIPIGPSELDNVTFDWVNAGIRL